MENEPVDLRCALEQADKYDSGPIEVLVGASQSKFYVHEKLIRRSAFFDKALTGEWKENQFRQVKLPEDSPETFKCYIHWLYTGYVPTLPLVEFQNEFSLRFVSLANMYGLGERLLDNEFKDRVLDTIVVSFRDRSGPGGRKRYPGAETIKAIYSSTTESSPIRRLIVDMYTVSGGNSSTVGAEHPVEFLADLARSLLVNREMSQDTRKRKYAEIDTGNPCSYHHHDLDKPCNANIDAGNGTHDSV